jgi:sporulation protein YlmC with PRC-barrel domain
MLSNNESKVPFTSIIKIGEDVILVDMWYNEKRGVTSE